MAKDTYNNFDELKKKEALITDYIISISNVGSTVTIIAPHGGRIEPRTSYIARSIARNRFNCYCFEGVKEKNNWHLHITSHNFNEPEALKLLARSQTVVAVHACTNRDSRVYLGGLDETLILHVTKALEAQQIMVAKQNTKYRGKNPANICNHGTTGKGIQLEISRGLRDDINKVHQLAETIHTALTDFARHKSGSIFPGR